MIQSHYLPTCDDVFEVLTRGPFPTGEHATDFPIERHLTVCHSCRELAEALRPATEMLSEHQAERGEESGDEKDSWPVYLAAAAGEDGRFPADQAGQEETAILPLRGRGSLAGLAISMALLVVLGVQAFGELGEPRSTSDGAAPPVRLPGTHLAADPIGPPAMGTAMAASGGKATAGASPVCSLAAVDTARDSAGDNGALLASLVAENFSAAECCSQCHHPEAAAKTSHTPKVSSAVLQRPQMLALVSRCAICHVPQ